MLRAFEERRLEYVLIGASAMAFHGLVRATEDLDLFIRATPENIERLRQALKDAYADDPQIDEISSADLWANTQPFVTIHQQVIFILTFLLALANQPDSRLSTLKLREIEGTHVRIATPAALYRMKKGTVRVRIIWMRRRYVNTLICKMNPDKRVQKFRSIEEMNKAPADPAWGFRELPATLRSLVGDCSQAISSWRVQIPHHRRGAGSTT